MARTSPAMKQTGVKEEREIKSVTTTCAVGMMKGGVIVLKIVADQETVQRYLKDNVVIPQLKMSWWKCLFHHIYSSPKHLFFLLKPRDRKRNSDRSDDGYPSDGEYPEQDYRREFGEEKKSKTILLWGLSPHVTEDDVSVPFTFAFVLCVHFHSRDSHTRSLRFIVVWLFIYMTATFWGYANGKRVNLRNAISMNTDDALHLIECSTALWVWSKNANQDLLCTY